MVTKVSVELIRLQLLIPVEIRNAGDNNTVPVILKITGTSYCFLHLRVRYLKLYNAACT